MKKPKGNYFTRNKKIIFFFILLILLIAFSVCFLSRSSGAVYFKNINDLSIQDNKKSLLFPPYYLKDSDIDSFSRFHFDSKGIILPVYDKYNPVTIAQYALSLYRYYLENPNFLAKKEFLKQADWLYNNATIKSNGSAVWEYDFPVKDQGAKPPWISAMAQGEIISVLVESHSLTGNKKYLDLAHKALKVFMLDIEEGGVRSYWPDGFLFYEEYAVSTKYKVLNGFIFSLAGVYDLYRLEKNPVAKKVFDEGIDSLKKHLENYDALFISYYSANKKPTECKIYNKVHVKQLSWLYYMTGDRFFLKYAKLFNAYCPSPKNYSIYTSSKKDIRYNEQFKLKDGDLFKNPWSPANQFPVKVKIVFDKKTKLSGLSIISSSEENFPQNYEIISRNIFGIKQKIDKSGAIIKKNDFHFKNLKNYTTQVIFPTSIPVREIEIVVYPYNSKDLDIKEIVPLFLEDDSFIDYYNSLFYQFSFLDYQIK